MFKTDDFDEEVVGTLEIANREGIISPKDFDFNKSDIGDVDYLVKYYAINMTYSLKTLLEEMDYLVTGVNIYCPFHDDKLTGKPSAKYHLDSDALFCFSESKSYSAYHALKLLYGLDMEKVFKDSWNKLNPSQREDLILKYSEGNNVKDDYVNPIWMELKPVREQFKLHQVTFKQHKNALYKILGIMEQEREKSLLGV